MSVTKTHYRTCHLCEAMCGLEIVTQDKEVLSIRGDKEDPLSRGHICPKAYGLKDVYEDPDRLKFPLKKTEDGWQQISWEAAFDEVADKLQTIQKKYGKQAVGIYQGNPSTHNLGTILFARNFVRALGKANRFSATSVDQLPHHLAAMYMFGHDFLLPIPDIDRTDCWVIMGGNPMVSNGSIMTAPDLGKRIRAIQKRGGKVITIDPRRTETSDKVDQHIFIKPSTDVWLLLALIREVFEQNWVDLKHLEKSIPAEEVAFLKKLTNPYTINLAAQKTGIDAITISTLAKEFATAKSAIFYGRLGISVVEFGGISHWLLNCLNIITGNMDVAGGMMFPSPAFDTVGNRAAEKMRFGRWKSRVRGLPEFNGELPAVTMAEEILTSGEGQIKAMVTSCGNPILSVPNGKKLEEAFEQLDFMVSIDIYLNETTRHADIILPPATGLEVPHYDVVFHQLAIRNTSKYSPIVFEKEAGTKYDYEIYTELTKRLQADSLPKDEKQRQGILFSYHLTPEIIVDNVLKTGQYSLSLKDLKAKPHGIDLGPLQSRFPDRLQTRDKTIHLTPDLFVQDLERLQDTQVTDGLLLIGRRHLRSNNSWMHNSQRFVKGRNRCTLLMHPNDAQQRGLEKNAIVVVQSNIGKVEIPVEISDEIMEGVVSIPHGWGHHRKGTRLAIAEAHAGVSVNDLIDESLIDALSGNAAVNGVPVKVFAKKIVENY